MRALLHKELRQVLPAQLLVALLVAAAWFMTAEPQYVFAPFVRDGADLHFALALFYIVEGLLLGFAQFGMERWARTEAYLVHRAAGHGAAFAAKLLAGLAGLAVIIALPPLLFGLWHLGIAHSVPGGQPVRLAYAALASSTALGGYAVGVFASQVRRPWGSRVGLAVLGGATLLYFTKLASNPVADLGHASALRYLLVQVTLAIGVLAVSYGMFRAGDDLGRAWPRVTALAFALVALELFVPPYLVAPTALSRAARKQVLASYPELVVDAQGAVFLVRPRPSDSSDPVGGPARRQYYDLTDARGRPVPREQADRYQGFSFDYSPYLTIYRPSSTPLEWDHPRDDSTDPTVFAHGFVFDGPWRTVVTQGRDCVLATGRGELWMSYIDERGRRCWTVQRPFSDEVAVAYAQDRGAERRPLFVDLGRGALWTLDSNDPRARPELVPVALPAGDRLAGVERLQGLFRARAGLYEPLRVSDGLLVRGERGLYAWSGAGELVDWNGLSGADRTSLGEQEVARVGLDLVPGERDGLAYRLEVREREDGTLLFAHDYRPTGSGQRIAAGLAGAASLLSAPIGALGSWLQPRDASRDVRYLDARFLGDPLLMGREHAWILLANLLLAALLAAVTWRRMSGRAERPELRLLWTVAVALLGLAAFFLCLALEPRPRRAAVVQQPREARRAALVIQTA